MSVHRFEMATDSVTEQRTVIKFYVKLEKTLQETNVDLQKVYGNSTLKYASVRKWFVRFSEGRESVKDDNREGRPISVKSKKLVSCIEEWPSFSVIFRELS